MTTPVIRSRRLLFGYNASSTVLSDLEVEIPQGSIYGLLGPNGCGKSTFLRLILGQGHPIAGELTVFGLDAAKDYVDIRSRTGYVPQENDLDPELTVQQNLDLIASFYGARWAPEIERAKLKQFNLDRKTSANVGDLSSGLKQRLSLVAALAVDPDLLVLDEPTAGLDAVVRRDFAEAIIEFMAEDPGRTVVISSHLLSEIESMVDHIGILQDCHSGTRRSLIVEASLNDLKERAVIVEVASQSEGNVGDDWLDSLEVLSRQRLEGKHTFVLWAETAAQRRDVETLAQRNGARIVHQASLDDIFVRLFRG